MPTARELLEQADALMRRNRERAVRAGIAQHVPDIPAIGDGIPEIAAEIPELTEVVTIGAPTAVATALDDVPELVDAVDAVEESETEIAPIADLSDVGSRAPAVPDVDSDGGDGRNDSAGDDRSVGGDVPVPRDVPVPEPIASASPAFPESVPEAEPVPAPTAVPPPRREPGRLWSLFSFGRKSESAAPTPTVQPITTPAEDEGSTGVAMSDETITAPPHVEPSAREDSTAEAKSDETLAAPPGVEPSVREVSTAEATSDKKITTLPAVEPPVREGGTVVAKGGEPIAVAPPIELPVREVPATDVAGVASTFSIDGTVPAPAVPIGAEASMPPSASPIAAKPAMADDWARWEALAEEIRMQVLQRIDIFTDTRLRDQLAVQLQPIVDRASAELVTTINEHVGKLIRAYIAEAIEREIETWRKGNS